MNKATLLVACAALLACTGTQAHDYDAGEKKAHDVCFACHGPEGSKPITPETPRLAGQYYDYLYHSLMAYRKGHRNNPMMSPMAKALSKDDVENLAWYFSKQQGLQTKY